MRMVQMTLDDELVGAVDKVVKDLKTTRSAFTRKALRDALGRYHARRLEEQHRKGYARHPVRRGELSVWEKEQKWGGDCDHIQTVSKGKIGSLITTLSAEQIARVREAISFALAL